MKLFFNINELKTIISDWYKRIVSNYIHIDIKKVKITYTPCYVPFTHTYTFTRFTSLRYTHRSALILPFFILSSCYDVDLLAVIGVFFSYVRTEYFLRGLLESRSVYWVCVAWAAGVTKNFLQNVNSKS